MKLVMVLLLVVFSVFSGGCNRSGGAAGGSGVEGGALGDKCLFWRRGCVVPVDHFMSSLKDYDGVKVEYPGYLSLGVHGLVVYPSSERACHAQDGSGIVVELDDLAAHNEVMQIISDSGVALARVVGTYQDRGRMQYQGYLGSIAAQEIIVSPLEVSVIYGYEDTALDGEASPIFVTARALSCH